MFKLLNLIFYIIYNSYYKHGNFKNDMPAYTVFFIFAISFFCQLLLLVGLWEIIEDPYRRDTGISKLMNYFMVLSCVVITYFLFYLNKKYRLIYETYKANSFADSRLGKFMGWSFIILSILSPFIFILIRNKIYFGNWV